MAVCWVGDYEFEIKEYPMTNKRVIVAEACKGGDIVLVRVHHSAEFMQSQFESMRAQGRDIVQGFVDNEGNFLNRYEAWEVAKKSGQIKHLVAVDSALKYPLFSDDLW